MKEKLEQLSALREEIYAKIEMYNTLAEEADFTERLALASSDINLDDWLKYEYPELDPEIQAEFDKAESKVQYVREYLSNNDRPFIHLSEPGVKGYWFPSSVNC